MKEETLEIMADLMISVGEETKNAIANHGLFNSAHEAYGVLTEEVSEFFDEVRKKHKLRSKVEMRNELIQVAAVAIKAAISLM